jgi:hypothetical protein
MFAHSKEVKMSTGDTSGSNNYRNVRSVMHIGMGGIYLLFGGIIIAYRNFVTVQLSAAMAYGIGGLMVLYGAFRLYRGFADMRQMRRERRERRP